MLLFSRILKVTAWLLISLSLVSCETFKPKPLSLNNTAHDFSNRTLTSPALTRFAQHYFYYSQNTWPPKTWNLDALTVVALYYHPDLSVALASLKASEAGIMTARMLPNPTASLSAQYQDRFIEGFSHMTYGLSFGTPIETAGKRGFRIKQASFVNQAERLRFANTIWQVRSNVRKSFLGFYQASQTLEMLQKEEQLQAKLVKLFRAQMHEGETSQWQLTQADIALNQTRLAVEEMRKQKVESLAQLGTALGVPASALERINFSFKDFERIGKSNLLLTPLKQRALLHRPDLLALLSDYEASQAALQLEIAKQYPDVTIGPGYQWAQGANVYTLGPTLVLPIFNQNQGPIAYAKARREEAGANVMALQANIMGQLTQNYKGYLATLNKLNVADRLFTQQVRSWKSIKRTYHAGEIGKFELQTAALEYTKAEQARFDTLIQVQKMLGALEDAVQCPLNHKQCLTMDASI
ncbi:MAG TPA: TolC family protein [Candidatus Babeliales bacterium]|nr:TolC family protein [Candidatus Babeliales bacterium]